MDKELWRKRGRRAALVAAALMAAAPAAAQVARPDAPLFRTTSVGEDADPAVEDAGAANAGAAAEAEALSENPEAATDAPPPGGGSGAALAGRDEAAGVQDAGEEAEVDPAAEVEPADGLLAEPEGPLDGDLSEDGRLDAPVAASGGVAGEPSSAGRVPAEEIDPFEPEPAILRTAHPEEEADPFEAVGLGIGSFRLFPELELGTVLTDNVQETAGGSSDAALELTGSLRLQSEWSIHSLEATAQGRASFQGQFPEEDDRELTLGLRGRLDVTEETGLEAGISYDLRQESRSAVDFPQGAASRPQIETTRATLALNHRINRLFMRAALGLRRDNESAGGSGSGAAPATNDDFSEGEVLLRAGYEVSPGLSIFAEGSGGRRTFDQVADGDGRLRDASLRELRGGFVIELAPKLFGELALGHARLDPDESRLEGADGLVLDGSLEWQPSALTTVRLVASSTLEPTTLAGAAGILGQSYDIEVRHELRRNLAMTAGAGTSRSDYQGAQIEEWRTTARLGAEYILSREWALSAGYEHLLLESSEPGSDYQSSTLRLAARLRR